MPGMVLGPRDRDLSKYNTPMLNDSSQPGHSVVSWDTQGQQANRSPSVRPGEYGRRGQGRLPRGGGA